MTPMEELREQAAKACKGIADGAELVSDSEEARIRHEGILAGANACAVAVSNIPLPAPAALPQAGEVERIEVERDADGNVMICGGCGSVETVASIRLTHPTALTCCPERTMIRAEPTPTETPTAAAPDDGLMGRWMPIETAPKDGTRFLALCKGIIGIWYWQGPDGGRPVGWRETVYVYKPSNPNGPDRWTPLPAAPATLSTATGDEAQQGEG